jgi:hypothetical protein
MLLLFFFGGGVWGGDGEVLGIKPRTSHALGKCSITKSLPSLK